MRSSNLLLLLFLSLAVVVSPCLAESEAQSRSIKESTKRGIFLQEVIPRPRSFEWSGHSVSVGECWLERNTEMQKAPFLCFRLSIDQSLTEELAIQKNKFRSIEFREEGSVNKTEVISSTVFYPMRNYLSRLRKGTGEIVHFAELPTPVPKRIAIRLYTNNHETDVHEKSETVLRFNLKR